MIRIEVPDDSPFFAGHFPGHPILPGITHLAFVARALGGSSFSEVRTLKLRRPVLPGDALDLIHEETGAGTVRFELLRGEEVVSSGTVRLELEDRHEEIPFASSMPSPFPPPAKLIPHAPPALLVESILEASSESASSIAVIPEDSPFVEAGRAPAFVGLEAGAQTAAAMESLAREGGSPRIGYVVGIRNAHFRVPWLPAGRPLAVAVKLTGSAPPLSIYQVSLGGEAELGIGLVSTYLDPAP